ncbi:hypothetical protein GOB93_20560 [Acetobacter musti]|uniref:Uncharacterized protein n=1 Tax=Acetobacter musti TaxID=864732 RepID=A0ABX0JTW7_9PROT|nr:hypothetical protein [Acetobacter musti]NHN86948.1 hypothetical protein [Acetobacter musti]
MDDNYIAWRNRLSRNWKLWRFYNASLVSAVRKISRRILPATVGDAVREVGQWTALRTQQNTRTPVDLWDANWRPRWVIELLTTGQLLHDIPEKSPDSFPRIQSRCPGTTSAGLSDLRRCRDRHELPDNAASD